MLGQRCHRETRSGYAEKRPREGECHRTLLSSSALASLILVAMYGLPPLSGWLASMMRRWASFTRFFVNCDSLWAGRSHQHPDLAETRPERPTHLRPSMSFASFRSILLWNPPMVQSPLSSPTFGSLGEPAIMFMSGESCRPCARADRRLILSAAAAPKACARARRQRVGCRLEAENALTVTVPMIRGVCRGPSQLVWTGVWAEKGLTGILSPLCRLVAS